MGVLARTDVQTFDRTPMYETKSYAQRSKRSDCRIQASGAIVEYMGAIAGVRPKPHGAIDFYSLGEGSFL